MKFEQIELQFASQDLLKKQIKVINNKDFFSLVVEGKKLCDEHRSLLIKEAKKRKNLNFITWLMASQPKD